MNQRLQVENIMKRVMGLMGEDLAGEYHSLHGLSPAQLSQCFKSEVFSLTGDDWARDNTLQWTQGRDSSITTFKLSSIIRHWSIHQQE